jgi:hypothetical protein
VAFLAATPQSGSDSVKALFAISLQAPGNMADIISGGEGMEILTGEVILG